MLHLNACPLAMLAICEQAEVLACQKFDKAGEGTAHCRQPARISPCRLSKR
jgi:hypothetical protein